MPITRGELATKLRAFRDQHQSFFDGNDEVRGIYASVLADVVGTGNTDEVIPGNVEMPFLRLYNRLNTQFTRQANRTRRLQNTLDDHERGLQAMFLNMQVAYHEAFDNMAEQMVWERLEEQADLPNPASPSSASSLAPLSPQDQRILADFVLGPTAAQRDTMLRRDIANRVDTAIRSPDRVNALRNTLTTLTSPGSPVRVTGPAVAHFQSLIGHLTPTNLNTALEDATQPVASSSSELQQTTPNVNTPSSQQLQSGQTAVAASSSAQLAPEAETPPAVTAARAPAGLERSPDEVIERPRTVTVHVNPIGSSERVNVPEPAAAPAVVSSVTSGPDVVAPPPPRDRDPQDPMGDIEMGHSNDPEADPHLYGPRNPPPAEHPTHHGVANPFEGWKSIFAGAATAIGTAVANTWRTGEHVYNNFTEGVSDAYDEHLRDTVNDFGEHLLNMNTTGVQNSSYINTYKGRSHGSGSTPNPTPNPTPQPPADAQAMTASSTSGPTSAQTSTSTPSAPGSRAPSRLPPRAPNRPRASAPPNTVAAPDNVATAANPNPPQGNVASSNQLPVHHGTLAQCTVTSLVERRGIWSTFACGAQQVTTTNTIPNAASVSDVGTAPPATSSTVLGRRFTTEDSNDPVIMNIGNQIQFAGRIAGTQLIEMEKRSQLGYVVRPTKMPKLQFYTVQGQTQIYSS